MLNEEKNYPVNRFRSEIQVNQEILKISFPVLSTKQNQDFYT